MSDTTMTKSAAGKPGFLSAATMQKAVAFAALIALVLFFSISANNFAPGSNPVGIMQATAVNGVLGVAVTFVIISGGIDLSVGTMMTLTAVTAGLVLTNLGMPLPIGILAAIAAGAFMGAVSGATIAQLEIPPLLAPPGLVQIARGLDLFQ